MLKNSIKSLPVWISLMIISTASLTLGHTDQFVDQDQQYIGSMSPRFGNNSLSVSDDIIAWNHTYGDSSNNWVDSIIETADGGFTLVGYTTSDTDDRDVWIVKTDANGNIKWQQTYGGSSWDLAFSGIQTVDGGFALAGFTQSYGAGRTDFWLVKTDSKGELQWNQTYGYGDDESASSIIQTTDGGFALVGYSETEAYGAGHADAWLVKTDGSGEPQWNWTYGGKSNDYALSVIESVDGGFTIGGYTESFEPGKFGSPAAWLIKADEKGVAQWEKTYDGSGIEDIFQTSDEGFVFAGSKDKDFWLVKTNTNGDMEWQQTYGGERSDRVKTVVQTPDKGFALIGSTNSLGAGNGDYWLMKTNAKGEMEWSKTFGGWDTETATSGLQTSDGGFVLIGYTSSFGAGGYDAWLVKVLSSPPLIGDSDGDGLSDKDEIEIYNTDPYNQDTDDDELTDKEEVLTYNTDPLDADTDKDTHSDSVEVDAGTNPNDPEDHPHRREPVRDTHTFSLGTSDTTLMLISQTDDKICYTGKDFTVKFTAKTQELGEDTRVQIDAIYVNLAAGSYTDSKNENRAYQLEMYGGSLTVQFHFSIPSDALTGQGLSQSDVKLSYTVLCTQFIDSETFKAQFDVQLDWTPIPKITLLNPEVSTTTKIPMTTTKTTLAVGELSQDIIILFPLLNMHLLFVLWKRRRHILP